MHKKGKHVKVVRNIKGEKTEAFINQTAMIVNTDIDEERECGIYDLKFDNPELQEKNDWWWGDIHFVELD